MIQVVMNGVGSADVLGLVEVEVPKPKEREVLIEVHAAGINRPDIAQREGKYPPPPGASPILGLEVSGTVCSVGAGSKFSPGAPVCALVPGGGYAEYCVAPDEQCLPIPRGLTMQEAAGIPETFFTVWANVFQIGHLKRGEKILVHGGTSGIGTAAIQLAHAFGAEVYATAGSAEKCEACIVLGARTAMNYKTHAFDEEILRLTSKQGVDLILDMIGGEYTDKNISCLAQEGRLVQIATQQGALVKVNLMKIMQKRLTVTGSTMRPRSREDKGRIAAEIQEKVWPLFEKKQIKVLIDRVFPLAEVAKAHVYLESGQHIGKIILQVR
jgi:NADPH2:quinone reductase